jgi:hypothetical protein
VVERRRATYLLILAAVLLGGAAYWFASRDFTPEAPRPSFNGRIAFATTGLENSISVTATPEQDPESGEWSVLRLGVGTRNVNGPVAVALAGDARVNPSARPHTAVPVVPRESTKAGLTASGLSAAYFSPRAQNWPWEPLDRRGRTDVIVALPDPNLCGNDQCFFSLRIPLRKPMMTTAGGSWALSTPTFGAPLDEDPLASRRLFPFVLPRGSKVNRQFTGDWFLPDDLEVRFGVGKQVADSVQLLGTAPERALGGVWRGRAEPTRKKGFPPEYWPSASDVLKVDAIFDRPAVQRALEAKDAHQQFYAGILLALAVSLLIWAAELWLTPRLTHATEHPR